MRVRQLAAAAVLFLGMAMAPGSVQAQQQAWSEAEREAWQAVEQAWQALRAEDVERFIATFHPRFLGWSTERELPLDLAAERAGTEAFLAAYDWESYHIEPVGIRVVGDVAVVHYRYREVVRARDGGAVSDGSGHATQVLTRGPGGWKTLTTMFGPVPAK